jgi:hypothetical protein
LEKLKKFLKLLLIFILKGLGTQIKEIFKIIKKGTQIKLIRKSENADKTDFQIVFPLKNFQEALFWNTDWRNRRNIEI